MDKQGLTETCHCGHDITSHYFDLNRPNPKRMTCLARGCECGRYANNRGPKPFKFQDKRQDTWPGLGDQ